MAARPGGEICGAWRKMFLLPPLAKGRAGVGFMANLKRNPTWLKNLNAKINTSLIMVLTHADV